MNRESSPDWSWIVQTHGGRVFGVAMRILGSVQDAEDVSQDVFLQAYEIYSAGAVQSWTGLLVRLATLRSLDLRRHNRPTAQLIERDCTANSDPAASLIRNELADSLRLAVGKLSDQQATVFAMSCYEKMTRDEIALVLCISPEAVSTSLYRARQRLAEDLNHLHEETC